MNTFTKHILNEVNSYYKGILNEYGHVEGKVKNNLQHYLDFMYDIGKITELPKSRRPIEWYVKQHVYDAMPWFVDAAINYDDNYDEDVDGEYNNYFDSLTEDSVYSQIMDKIKNKWTVNDRGLIYVERAIDIPMFDGKNSEYYDELIKKYYSIGECWSWLKGKGESYCSSNQDNQNYYHIVMQGWVHPDSIDWQETIYINLYSMSDECEVRMNDHAFVEIDKITYTNTGDVSDKLCTLPFRGPLVVNASTDKYLHNDETAYHYRINRGMDLDCYRKLCDGFYIIVKAINQDICQFKIVDDKGGSPLGDIWFDNITNPLNGFAVVSLNNKENLIKCENNIELLWKKPIEQWFDSASIFFDNGISFVMKYGSYRCRKHNLIRKDGTLVWPFENIEQWADDITNYKDFFKVTSVNSKAKQYFLTKNGEIYSFKTGEKIEPNAVF